jgi:hypothetical protein
MFIIKKPILINLKRCIIKKPLLSIYIIIKKIKNLKQKKKILYFVFFIEIKKNENILKSSSNYNFFLHQVKK